MELKRIEIRNFLGIGAGGMDFKRSAGITLIQGENNDSPSSISNGAGKSSIFEALFWALYGRTKRGVTGDAVISRAAKKDCSVTLYFDSYKLERTRKPDGLKLSQQDAAGDYTVDLTKGAVKETQELLDSIIKISELTFSKIAYFGQEDVKSFASLTDADLKKVFEQALGLTFLTDHLEKAKAHLAMVREKVMNGQLSLSKLDGEIRETEGQIEILVKASKDLRDRKQAEQLRILADITADNAEVEKLRRQYVETAAKAKVAEAEIATLQAKLDELKGYQRQLDERRNVSEKDSLQATFEVRKLEKELETLRDKVTGAPMLVGTPCETCRRPFSASDIANVMSGIRKQIEQCIATHSHLVTTAKTYKSQADEVAAVLSKLESAIEDQGSVVAAKRAVSDPVLIRAELTKQEGQTKTLLQRIEENQRVLSKLDAADATYERDIKAKKSWNDDREMEKSFIEKELIELKQEFETAEMLVEALGNGGMKSYIFDNVTPVLNKEINTYIKMLDDMEVDVSTVTKLKSGEYREKFHINVENTYGAAEFEGNSGGEKQKVNLAVALGFNKVFRAMSGGAVNAVFLDEPFESLDKGSSEGVIELCKAFREVGNVFVITHQDAIKDLITDIVTVKKNGAVATIC